MTPKFLATNANGSKMVKATTLTLGGDMHTHERLAVSLLFLKNKISIKNKQTRTTTFVLCFTC